MSEAEEEKNEIHYIFFLVVLWSSEDQMRKAEGLGLRDTWIQEMRNEASLMGDGRRRLTP